MNATWRFLPGLAPANDPRVVVIVVIDEPQGDKIGGGEVAGPVFARVVARALRVLNVEPGGGVVIGAASHAANA